MVVHVLTFLIAIHNQLYFFYCKILISCFIWHSNHLYIMRERVLLDIHTRAHAFAFLKKTITNTLQNIIQKIVFQLGFKEEVMTILNICFIYLSICLSRACFQTSVNHLTREMDTFRLSEKLPGVCILTT